MMDGHPAEALRQPLASDWPKSDLEHLGCCPVCGVTERSIAYEGLSDKIFFCAPGLWTMWRCEGCRVGYLDPRPTPQSIGRAYENYYTHNAGPDLQAEYKSFVKRLRRAVVHSYLNKVFGHKLKPSLPFGWMLMRLNPARAASTDYYYRHTQSPISPDDRLLDIGFGNGGFLTIAKNYLGLNVEGLEIDPQAIQAATKSGLTVYVGLVPGSGLRANNYFAITMSHVLEHLHDPVGALHEIYGLLKPGGRIWICVPNFAAASLRRFGPNSRLLEPPRHLVMFDARALEALLRATGFDQVTLQNDCPVGDFVHRQSLAMENGLDPNMESIELAVLLRQDPGKQKKPNGESAMPHSEFITYTAIRPF